LLANLHAYRFKYFFKTNGGLEDLMRFLLYSCAPLSAYYCRRQFARAISRRIFNDTKNLLIIIDREQTERVQAHLVDALKQYEMQLELKLPDRREWHLMNSLNFALALLTTIGHGDQLPETTAGQVILPFYDMFNPCYTCGMVRSRNFLLFNTVKFHT
uniref:Ion_trans_2 domain-containing protein n=1 Tax=Toxocara canis TaxID=6265 RepID=A0A183U1L2_TOXCA